MALLEKFLRIKKSTLPGAGKGLFTIVPIEKGTEIVEYKGQIVTWPQVEKMPDHRNGYVFYFSKKYCIDAWSRKSALARYANDAMGINRVKGVKNNCAYITHKKKCYITAEKNIPAGAEIFVSYGAEYWRTIRSNLKRAVKNNGKAILPHVVRNKKKKAKK